MLRRDWFKRSKREFASDAQILLPIHSRQKHRKNHQFAVQGPNGAKHLYEIDMTLNAAYLNVALALSVDDDGDCGSVVGDFESIMPPISRRHRLLGVDYEQTTVSNSKIQTGGHGMDCLDAMIPLDRAEFNEEKTDELYVGDDNMMWQLHASSTPSWRRRQSESSILCNKTFSTRCFDPGRQVRWPSAHSQHASFNHGYSHDRDLESTTLTTMWSIHGHGNVCHYCLEQVERLADYEQANNARAAILGQSQSSAESTPLLRAKLAREATAVGNKIIQARRKWRARGRQPAFEREFAGGREPTPDQYNACTLTRSWSQDRIQRHWAAYSSQVQMRVDKRLDKSLAWEYVKENYLSVPALARRWRLLKAALHPSYYRMIPTYVDDDEAEYSEDNDA